MAESVIVLKKKRRLGAQRRVHRSPVDGIHQIDIEIGHHRSPLLRHVGRRAKVCLFDVLKLTDQRLLRGASLAGIYFDRALVDHDRKSEAGMFFRLRHHQLGCLIRRSARTVPVDDHAVDAAADHVVDLAFHLAGVGRAVTDVHVVRASEPDHQVSVDLGRVAGIKQRMNVRLADIPGATVAIGLRDKTVGRAGVIGSLSRKGGGRCNEIARRTHTRCGQ